MREKLFWINYQTEQKKAGILQGKSQSIWRDRGCQKKK